MKSVPNLISYLHDFFPDFSSPCIYFSCAESWFLRFSEIGKSLNEWPICQLPIPAPRPTCRSLRSTWCHALCHALLAVAALATRAPAPLKRCCGRDGPVRSCAVALSDAASRLALRVSPGLSLARLTAILTGWSEAAARLHGLDTVVALPPPR
jgi:hypothetical protein